MGGNMAEKEWTVKDLTEALKHFPLDAKVYYEMGPNGPGSIGNECSLSDDSRPTFFLAGTPFINSGTPAIRLRMPIPS
jgi:hypothetical protein